MANATLAEWAIFDAPDVLSHKMSRLEEEYRKLSTPDDFDLTQVQETAADIARFANLLSAIAADEERFHQFLQATADHPASETHVQHSTTAETRGEQQRQDPEAVYADEGEERAELSNRLQRIKKDLDLTWEELTEQMDVDLHPQTVATVGRGGNGLTIDTARKTVTAAEKLTRKANA